jgi:DNA topoisomerase-2
VEVVTRYARLREDNKNKVKKGARLHGIPKLEDANKAGSKESANCTLIVTEGDSAKALAVAGLSVVGRDLYGVYPVRGKFLNVRDATEKRMSENQEIMELKRILGLQSGADYATAEGRASLRYGRVMLMTDQDADGSHIKGLFINFVHVLWPSLVQHNDFLLEFVTPLIKASKGKQTRSFFSLAEYKAWPEDRTGWKTKYYKGLGTSSSAEAREYFSNLDKHVKKFKWVSKEDDAAIELAFSKLDGTVASDKRKRWLEQYNPAVFVDRAATRAALTYAEFVNKDLVAYMHYSNMRAIPHVLDGLKLGQRKVLHSIFKKGLRTGDEIKVVQLAGYVSEVAAYHHGESALHGTIVHMASSYVGSNNNVPLLEGVGQFGTRLQGGKDAASPRYIYCGIGAQTRDLIREEDDELLETEEEDGERVQPKHYMPVVPLILINGQDGVGTGWSTNVPPYNPIEVVDNVLNRLEDRPLAPMIPWFRGYK